MLITARRSAAVALAAGLMAVTLAGCGRTQAPDGRALECAGLASDIAPAGLVGIPDQTTAHDVGVHLDVTIPQYGDPTVHLAAIQLHTRMHAIERAWADGDQAKVEAQTARARTEAQQVAASCGLPADQFLGRPRPT